MLHLIRCPIEYSLAGTASVYERSNSITYREGRALRTRMLRESINSPKKIRTHHMAAAGSGRLRSAHRNASNPSRVRM